MALIKCPECGKEISDTSKACVHCGFKLEVSEKEKKKNKKKIVKIVIILVVVALLAGLVLFIRAKVAESKARAQEIRERSRAELYKSDLYLISFKILSAGAETERCGNLVRDVWYNTIWEKDDPDTDIYTKSNGVFYDDFNDALAVLFASDTYKTYVTNIKDYKTEISTSMKDMKNPPEDYADAYEALKDFYDEFISFSNICINPSGNYNTYSSNFTTGDNSLMAAYNKLEPYISY